MSVIFCITKKKKKKNHVLRLWWQKINNSTNQSSLFPARLLHLQRSEANKQTVHALEGWSEGEFKWTFMKKKNGNGRTKHARRRRGGYVFHTALNHMNWTHAIMILYFFWPVTIVLWRSLVMSEQTTTMMPDNACNKTDMSYIHTHTRDAG